MTQAIAEQDTRTISLHFELRLPSGEVVDSTRNREVPAQLKLGDGNLPAPFEGRLVGLSVGDRKTFTLQADEAFGQPNPDNCQHLPRSRFDRDMPLSEGLVISFEAPGGGHLPGVVKAWDDQRVTVDFNHPLAGSDVIFDVEILALD
jgi:FKBP-type peptidyl-prolyl cis-trans isomerase SlpA